MIKIRIGKKRIIDRKTGFAVRRITVKSSMFTVSWSTSKFIVPYLASRVVEEFKYNGDADGFIKSYSEYVSKLEEIYKNADKGLKVSITHYREKLEAEANTVINIVNALKFAENADNIHRAYGRFIGAIGGPFIGLRVRPLLFTWGHSINLRYIDYNAAEKINETLHGYELIVYEPKNGGKLYCIDAYVHDVDDITCSRFVRSTIDNPSDFDNFAWGIVESYSVEKEAANVLQEVMIYLLWIRERGYNDNLVNDDNISLLKTYHKMLVA